jgi:uncharacterized protein (DUF1810 family)
MTAPFELQRFVDARLNDLKFCSSMTLFGAVSSDPEFAEAIAKFHGGTPDQRTLDLLAR